jgi:hypothetical protein
MSVMTAADERAGRRVQPGVELERTLDLAHHWARGGSRRCARRTDRRGRLTLDAAIDRSVIHGILVA